MFKDKNVNSCWFLSEVLDAGSVACFSTRKAVPKEHSGMSQLSKTVLRGHRLSACPSSMFTEIPIGVAILYLGGSILIENAINKHAGVDPRLEP